MTETAKKRAELDALQRKIAEARGWRELNMRHLSTGGDVLFGIAPGTPDTPKPEWSRVPDWPRDTAAALSLCRDTAHKLNLTVEITLYPGGDVGVASLYSDIRDNAPPDASVAHTLSCWALAALRTRGE